MRRYQKWAYSRHQIRVFKRQWDEAEKDAPQMTEKGIDKQWVWTDTPALRQITLIGDSQTPSE